MNMVPAGRPQMKQAELLAKVDELGLDRTKHPFFVVGIRGYYRDTMGAPGVNDRGIYDDALFLVSPTLFASYNGNCDPSRVRKGSGTGAGKGMAVLKPGVHIVYKFRNHRGKYLALCQDGGPVTVTRDGVNGNYDQTGMFGINIHKGGFNTTSSEGCQTIHPNQWAAFIAAAVDQAKRYHGPRWNSTAIPYVLIGAS